MGHKQEQHFFKGMQRDLTVSKFSPEYVFEAQNIRITAREKDTLMTVTNEKGNKRVPLQNPSGEPIEIDGVLLGYNVLNDYITLFTKGVADNIYRLEKKDGYFETVLLYSGNLGFNLNNPIETLGTYENDNIQKVYWIDGLSQTRVINIVASEEVRNKWYDGAFNFVQELALRENITVTRNDIASGSFSSGVIQYAFSYYNLYGQESNIFYTSPLEYISMVSRGASPEEKVSNSFEISIQNADTKFDYIRIYSIHRASIDATPNVLNVVDLPLNAVQGISYETTIDSSSSFTLFNSNADNIIIYNGAESQVPLSNLSYTSGVDQNGNPIRTWSIPMSSITRILEPNILQGVKINISTSNTVSIVETRYNSGSIVFAVLGGGTSLTRFTYEIAPTANLTYVDNGTTGTSVDPTELLYIGGEDVVFQTMTQKDNTLFLGNANIQRGLVSDELVTLLRTGYISYSPKYLGNYTSPSGFYPYRNSLYLGANIKTFKSKEWYRFGLQFQHKSGKWSEPIWVSDSYNEYVTPSYDGALYAVQASYFLQVNMIEKAVEEGFVRIRGVVVYPSLTDREVIAQGMLCPTVYNVNDRFSNSPFAQASWFSRPSLPFDIERNKSEWNQPISSLADFTTSRAAVISNSNVNLTVGGTTPRQVYIDIVNKGAWAEFRHNHPIPDNWERNAEIQCLAHVPESPYVLDVGSNLNSWAASHSEFFFVDQSILTLHSPDIEFDDRIQNLNSSGLKLRIVGIIPFTANASEIDLQTSTPANDPWKIGFYKEYIGSENNSYHGIKNLMSGAYWFDKMTDMEHVDDDHGYTEAFMVYAWHRNGSLNNQGPATDGNIRTAMLDKKKISNLKFSSFSYFFNQPWLAYLDGDNAHRGITEVSIFNSDEQSLIRIPAPSNSGLGSINYYGNIDKVVTAPRVEDPYQLTVNFSGGPRTENLNRVDGYPIVVTGVNDAASYAHQLFSGGAFPIQFVKRSDGAQLTRVATSSDPVRIKYKSTPHAVFALNYATDGRQVLLPTNREMVYDEDNPFLYTLEPANPIPTNIPNTHFFWNARARSISDETTVVKDDTYQDVIDEYVSDISENNYSYLYLAELYNDNIPNRFGGQTEEAFENNHWLPASEPYNLVNADGSINYIFMYFTEGDTFFQRYDCLKTYPYTLEDQNSVTDIASFMCETRVNIDGRYDRNRGQINNLAMTPTNFNLMNPVYTQQNNFFNYRGVNREKFNLTYFPNTVTWTKEKQLGGIIDAWTNITMASVLDLDGDKGEVVSLNTFKNEIFAFQRMGISNILFNSRVQIPTSDGLPIEITNSLKVDGKRYVSNIIGCTNKWSIVETPIGLYFVDNDTDSLYLFNGGITNLSEQLGFGQWIGSKDIHDKWEPVNYNNYRSFYDKINGDVYFTHKDHCLVYSEQLGQFTSFMSYEKVPLMVNASNGFYAFKNGVMWEQFAGEYNMFFDEYKPFSITFVANADEPFDKIFNTIEFRADSWNGDELIPNGTFDTLEVWNEYQKGATSLTNIIGHPSPLKRKFRIWRANIPRDSINKMDRIRNTWAFIKLGMNTPNTNRTEFHDAIVHYFI